MGDVALVVAMAAVTYASRAAFLVRAGEEPGGLAGRFLDTFPLALFVALATLGLAAPDGSPDATLALWAGAGGVIGAAATKRSLLGVLIFGGAFYWLFRALS